MSTPSSTCAPATPARNGVWNATPLGQGLTVPSALFDHSVPELDLGGSLHYIHPVFGTLECLKNLL
jgi:hypothetical protein